VLDTSETPIRSSATAVAGGVTEGFDQGDNHRYPCRLILRSHLPQYAMHIVMLARSISAGSVAPVRPQALGGAFRRRAARAYWLRIVIHIANVHDADRLASSSSSTWKGIDVTWVAFGACRTW
jgi:hypothetical protein